MSLISTARAGVGASAYTARDYYTQRPPALVRHTFVAERVESASERDWSDVLGKLRTFRSLDDDWDGQGAVAPHTAVVDFAIAMAKQFCDDGKQCPHFAVAGVNGTVIFEWHLPSGFLEIEVTTPDAAEQRWVRKGTTVVEVSLLGWGA